MIGQCEGCAFGVAGAACEPLNRLRAAICAVSGRPFFCHHSRSGEEIDWQGPLSEVAFYGQSPNERRLCEGWKQQVAQLAAGGHFRITDNAGDRAVLLRYQRMLGADALQALNEFVAEDGPPKETARRRLESILEALHAHRSFDLQEIKA